MDDRFRNELRDLERKQRELTRAQEELAAIQRRLKESMLAGAMVETGARHAELRLLPGRDSSSKNPDDYELIVSFVS
jgi:hypothetical protein